MFGNEEIAELLIVDLGQLATAVEVVIVNLTSTYVALSCQFLLLEDLLWKLCAAPSPESREGARMPEPMARWFGSSFSKRMAAARGIIPVVSQRPITFTCERTAGTSPIILESP